MVFCLSPSALKEISTLNVEKYIVKNSCFTATFKLLRRKKSKIRTLTSAMDVPVFKSEPASSAGSSDEGQSCDFFFSDANVKSNSTSSGHVIKMEIIFPDLPVEFEPRCDAEGDLRVNNGTEMIIKKVNNPQCCKAKGNLAKRRRSVSKPETADEGEDDGRSWTGVDITNPDVKQECLENSMNADFSTVHSSVFKNSTDVPTTSRRTTKINKSNKEISTSEYHSEEKQFSCSVCACTFSKKGSLRRHTRTHSEKKIFSCPRCIFKCNRKELLRNHLISHTGIKPYGCLHCEYTCKQKGDLKRHTLTHTGEKPFSCPHCTYASNRKGHLRVHILTHTGERPFSCSHCPYSCNKKGNLRSHILTHTGMKPFSCSQCTYTCYQKGQLRIHVLSHTGQKPFSCPHCVYMCKLKGDLRRHLVTHTGEKPFSCSHCSYICNRKGQLTSHLLTHTGEKPFSCALCSYTCNRKGSLKRHELTHIGQKSFS